VHARDLLDLICRWFIIIRNEREFLVQALVSAVYPLESSSLFDCVIVMGWRRHAAALGDRRGTGLHLATLVALFGTLAAAEVILLVRIAVIDFICLTFQRLLGLRRWRGHGFDGRCLEPIAAGAFFYRLFGRKRCRSGLSFAGLRARRRN
jgi:hypothetical protein